MAMINNPCSELSREQHVPAMTLNQPDVTFIGNRFENSEVLFVNRSKTPRELEADCKQALGSTNPDDHLRDIRAKKPSLVDADYEWVLHNKKFQKWIDERNKSQLLWISGSRMGDNTMMSIYLIRELREMKKSTVLFFFVDSREEERKSAVDILRGLILLLVKARPSLLQRHLIKEFEYQRKDLFNSKYSLMTLWKIFATMARDQETGDLIIIIDALDTHENGAPSAPPSSATQDFDEVT
ncbi:hypothetical protein V2G26_013211 [Clonostachys chloroleuca]